MKRTTTLLLVSILTVAGGALAWADCTIGLLFGNVCTGIDSTSCVEICYPVGPSTCRDLSCMFDSTSVPYNYEGRPESWSFPICEPGDPSPGMGCFIQCGICTSYKYYSTDSLGRTCNGYESVCCSEDNDNTPMPNCAPG